jgi:hypothetical protein
VVAFVQLLMVAGNETATHLIGNAARTLLAHPAELARVRGDLARVPALVEETLRFDSPIQMIFRTATREVELAGGRPPAGATAATPPATSGSASATTSAWARRWHGSRRAWRWRRWCRSWRGSSRSTPSPSWWTPSWCAARGASR